MSALTTCPSTHAITTGVVMIEVTTRTLSTTEPYRCLGREKSIGTGFRVNRNWFPHNAKWNTPSTALFLTNWHVVQDCEARRCRLRTARCVEYCSGRVVHAVPQLDFAVVAVDISESSDGADEDDPFCSASGVVLAEVTEIDLHTGALPPMQQKIVCCGFPSMLEAYTTSGNLGGRNSGNDLSDMYIVDVSVNR